MFFSLAILVSSAWAQTGEGLPDVYLKLTAAGREVNSQDVEKVNYLFVLDLDSLRGKRHKSMSALTIATNAGNLVFQGPFDLAPTAGRYALAVLVGPAQLEALIISKATAQLDGQTQDVTKNIDPGNYLTFPIVVGTPQYLACPTKDLDFWVVEGVFMSIVEGDYVHVVLNVKGKEEMFLVSNAVSDFFLNEANYNKRVKLLIRKEQRLEPLDSQECLTSELIDKVLVLGPPSQRLGSR
ncbi:MAG: hypothetical protein LBR11_11065 [Deltaproteobacteria bacterium]|nr:hypothetical protein [Deltaproteobacteria bacterium]